MYGYRTSVRMSDRFWQPCRRAVKVAWAFKTLTIPTPDNRSQSPFASGFPGTGHRKSRRKRGMEGRRGLHDRLAGVREPDLSADVVAAIADVRGDLRVVHELVPSTTALVVIDMQNFFVEPGAALEVAAARDIVPNVNLLARAMRDGGRDRGVDQDDVRARRARHVMDGVPPRQRRERRRGDVPRDRTRRARAIGCGRSSRSTIATSSSTSTASARSSRVRRTCRRCSTNGASTRWSSSARSPTCAANRRLVTR